MPSETPTPGSEEYNQSPVHSEDKAADHTQETQPPSPPIVTPSTTQQCCKHKEITCNQKRDWIDKTTIGLEAFGLSVLIIYTIATLGLWCITKDSFVVGTRAQIVVTNFGWRTTAVTKDSDKHAIQQICDPDGTGVRHICFDVGYSNGGKSPAYGVQKIFHVLRPSQFLKAQETIDNLPIPAFSHLAAQGYPMSAETHLWGDHTIEPICEGVDCVTAEEADEMINQDLPLYIYGIIRYHDIFGEEHTTRACFQRPKQVTKEKCQLPGGCFGYCEFGNWVDKPGDVPPPKKPWYCPRYP